MSNEASTPPNETYEKVTISLPTSILINIDRLAVADRRTRSNYIVKTLEGLLDETETHNTSEA